MFNIPMTQFQRWLTTLLVAAALLVLCFLEVVDWVVFLGFVLGGAAPSPFLRTEPKPVEPPVE